MPGILDFLNGDDARLGIGLLAAGGPTTDPNQSGLGQRLAAGLQFADASRAQKLREDLLRSQMAENDSQAALRAAQVAKQAQIQSLTSGLLGDFSGGTSMGGGSNVPSAAGLRGVPIEKIAALKAAGGPDLTEAWKAVNIPTSLAAGSYSFIPGQSPTYMADPSKGLGIGPNGVYALPGAAVAQGQLEGAKAGAQEDAKAARDLVEVKGPDGRTYRVPRSQVLAAAGGSTDPYVSAVEFTESRGNPYAVSPKGAQGSMQVMPGTSASPGFGVTPARDGSPAELRRVGQDYWAAMNERYKNPALAAIAYNWGPDNADKWLKAGGDYDKLPAETKSYVSQVMTRGAVNSFGRPQGGPSMAGNVAELSPEEQARNNASAEFMKGTAKNDADKLEAWRSGADAGNAMLGTAQKLRDIEKQGIYSGGGSQAKTAVASMVSGLTGITPKELPGSEAFNAEASNLVLGQIKALGANPSNADREFIMKTIPQITNSPQAREALVNFMEQKGRQSMALYKAADEYAGKNNSLRGFDPFSVKAEAPATPTMPGKLKSPPSQSDLQNTALKYNMTVDQVKQKLGIQ